MKVDKELRQPSMKASDGGERGDIVCKCLYCSLWNVSITFHERGEIAFYEGSDGGESLISLNCLLISCISG